jgi:hypothetical protein
MLPIMWAQHCFRCIGWLSMTTETSASDKGQPDSTFLIFFEGG